MLLMNTLRKKIFAWILKRQATRKVIMPQWDKVRSVVILYPTNDIQHLIKELEEANKEVVHYTMPNQNDICWLTERPKGNLIEEISSRQYDLLIDLTQKPSRTMQYMAMYVRADFKVSRHILEGIYDMTIDTPAQETPEYLFQQILRYIDMFGKKEIK